MLDGLTYVPNTRSQHQEGILETKAGIPRYRGQALGFSEWKFKVEGRLIAIENQAAYEDDANISQRKLIEFGQSSCRRLGR